MRPVDFEEADITMTEPKGMEDNVIPIRALRDNLEIPDPESGETRLYNYFITAWKPNKEDLEALNRGEPIYVQIIYPGLPPMSLFTLNTQGDRNDL